MLIHKVFPPPWTKSQRAVRLYIGRYPKYFSISTVKAIVWQ